MTAALKGRRALVTGASSGIGAALVRQLATLGADVHASARDSNALDALARETGCAAHVVDVTDTNLLEKLVASACPEILICNAGTNFSEPLDNADHAQIDHLVAVNLTAVLHTVGFALRTMKVSNQGHIVLVGSIAGHYALTGGNPVYHASKSGIAALAAQLRLDLCGHRIRVTEIAPGRTRTNIFANTIGDAERAQRQFLDGYEVLEPADVADAICYALAAPMHVNISHIEIVPTLQVIGGLTTVRPHQVPGRKESEGDRS
jgi:NADP-dependent 3-hydroxy acid dehydrogenase YdfG